MRTINNFLITGEGMSTDSILIVEPNRTLPSETTEIDKAFLLRLMDVVNNAVWLVDANQQLVAQNEVAGKMIGWSSAEVIGRSICQLVSAGNGSSCELLDLLNEAMEKQRPVSFSKGVLLATKKNQHILVGGKLSPVVRDSRAIGAVCAFWKLTSDEGNPYLRFEFADMASHLLRTPLSFIQTSIDVLMNANLTAIEQKAMLTRMQKQNQRLKNFVNELLKMLRLETEGMQASAEPITLLPLVERVLNLIRYEQPNHTFDFVYNDTLPTVMADITKTELILLNLLLSAVRRCPDGGHISIRGEAQESEVIISIVDDGEFIPPKMLERAFWQFYPVDDDANKVPSTYQLGLYTTKQLVELQNGRIWAESRPNHGSKFSFSMPVWEKNQ